MKQHSIRMMAAALLAGTLLTLGGGTAVQASPQGRRNTAIGLGALAVYGVVTKKPLVAGLAGGGAIYSYVKGEQEAKKQRARRAAARRVRHRTRRVYYVRRH